MWHHPISIANLNKKDGYEIRVSYYINQSDPQNWSAGKYLNPANTSDAYEDFDSDGLTNLEEYRMDTMGDYDHDYRADINDDDDDNDGIPTSVELQNHLDPFNSADAYGDLDHDGLSSLFEAQHNLSISDADTDHDGIADGEELKYWENRLSNIHPSWTAGQVLNMSVNYTINPEYLFGEAEEKTPLLFSTLRSEEKSQDKGVHREKISFPSRGV